MDFKISGKIDLLQTNKFCALLIKAICSEKFFFAFNNISQKIWVSKKIKCGSKETKRLIFRFISFNNEK
jgi:hypothetical protein